MPTVLTFVTGAIMTYYSRLMALVLIVYFHQSFCAADDWLGKEVYWKSSAVAKVGTEVVDKYQVLNFPAKVEDVNGEMLWLSGAWVRKSDCMDLQEAFDFYFEEVRRNPTSASSWRQRAICWKDKGELNNAIKDFDEAIRLDPRDAIAYRFRENAKSKLKDYTAFIKDCDEAIRLYPKNAYAYWIRGDTKYKLEDFTAAIKDYDEAIRLDPQYAIAYPFHGIPKCKLENYTAVIKDFDEAIRLDPKYARVYRTK